MPSDPNLNLLNDGHQSYAYDDLDQLISVTRGITATTFGYNSNGDRTEMHATKFTAEAFFLSSTSKRPPNLG